MSDRETPGEIRQMETTRLEKRLDAVRSAEKAANAKRLVDDMEKAYIAESPLPEATAAKYDKTPIYKGVLVLFPRALRAVAKVSRYGASKHQKPMGCRDYLNVPEAHTVYCESEMRHFLAELIGEPHNAEDDGLLHKAQKAWNALADLEVYLTPSNER